MSDPKNIVIKVTEPRAVVLPGLDSSRPEERAGLTLIPGENDVTAGYWQAAKKNPAVKIYVAAGIIVEQGEGKAVPLNKGLDGLTVKEALAKIAKIDSVQMLKDLREATTKKGIISELDKRIDALVAEV